MQNIKVRYHNEVTVNLGNFQNTKPGYEIEAVVEDGENPREVFERLETLVEDLLDKRVEAIREELNS